MNSRKLWVLFLGVSFVIVSLTLGTFKELSSRLSEAKSMGPYFGFPYLGPIYGSNTTAFKLTSGQSIAAFEHTNCTVLLVRNTNGSVEWSRELGFKRESSTNTLIKKYLKNVSFTDLKQTKGQVRIEFLFSWDEGAREKGFINLGPKAEFKNFFISW
jgi:hypothetical protein